MSWCSLSSAIVVFWSLCMACFFCFYFSVCLYCHRVLFSFPTRRSSDLSGRARGDRAARAARAARGQRVGVCRSEEHTSELQSPCNLVCRLLLEKKNMMMRMTISQHDRYVLHRSMSYN